VMQRDAVRCSMLQCDAVCCSVLQCVEVDSTDSDDQYPEHAVTLETEH